jgi:protocatechuate 3,4-dioxygenase beta subunit
MRSSRAACSRRRFLRGLAVGSLACAAPGAWAEELTRTPAQMEGPFYPDRLPLDTDNDLLVLNDSLDSAVGDVTYLSGRILDSSGEPIRGAVVEIWQADNNGAYLHSGSENADRRDKNFQGFGRFTTGSTGEYLFRTIKPVPYPGRTPHIHFAVLVKGEDEFTTQCYIKDHPGNARDGLFRSLRDEKARQALSVEFTPLEGSRVGELAARFDIVLGYTPAG